MQLLVILRILGLLLLVFSASMLPPVVIDLIYQENASLPFIESFVVMLVAGMLLFLPLRNHRRELLLDSRLLFQLVTPSTNSTTALHSSCPVCRW